MPEKQISKTHEVIVAKTLVDVKQDLVPVRVLNVKSETVIIYKGAVYVLLRVSSSTVIT